MHQITGWFGKNWRHVLAWIVLYLIVSNIIRLAFGIRHDATWPIIAMSVVSGATAEIITSLCIPLKKVSSR